VSSAIEVKVRKSNRNRHTPCGEDFSERQSQLAKVVTRQLNISTAVQTTHFIDMIRRAFLVCLLATAVVAFVPKVISPARVLPLQASPFDNMEPKIAAASAFVMANIPAIVLAVVEVEDDYEYGKVDAPIGLAVGAGILAILTALLPIALQGGEKAFEEIRERDENTFGKKNTDVLKKK
jgi:hypothetical protein